MIPRRTIRIGTFAGIPFGIHPLWLVIVVVITWSLAVGWYPQQVDGIATGTAWALGLLSALLLFASIVAHEYGHAIVARRRGIEVEEIDLWLLGGVSRMRGAARRPEDELAYAAAGPAVTLVVAAAFGLLLLALPSGGAPALRALVAYQAFINAALLVFNMLPAFPLDGGRVLRALIWRVGGDPLRATRAAATIGRGFGFGFIALGVFGALSGAPGGLWLAIIGVFLVGAAGTEALHAEAEELFHGVPARQLMSAPALCIAAEASVAQAVREVMLQHPHPAFPVVEEGRVIGMLRGRRGRAPARRPARGAARARPRRPRPGAARRPRRGRRRAAGRARVRAGDARRGRRRRGPPARRAVGHRRAARTRGPPAARDDRRSPAPPVGVASPEGSAKRVGAGAEACPGVRSPWRKTGRSKEDEMFVRVARFEGADPANRDARLARLQQEIEQVSAGNLPEGMPPEAAEVLRASVSRVIALVDRRDGTEASAVFCPTEDALRRVDQVLDAMSPADDDGRRTDVAQYDVVMDIEL